MMDATRSAAAVLGFALSNPTSISIQKAKVTASNAGPPLTVDVLIENNYVVQRLRYLGSYSPTVNDDVFVLSYGTGRRLVLGVDAATAPVPPPPDAWPTFVPVVDQGATVNIAKTVDRAAFNQVDREVTASVKVTMTAAGTASNAVLISLPVTGVFAANSVLGSGYWFDASANTFYHGVVVAQSTTRAGLYVSSGAISAQAGATGSGVTAALASGDILSYQVSYESAA